MTTPQQAAALAHCVDRRHRRIGEMPPAQAAAFVRAGMIGTTPRPVAPDAMRALLYAAWMGTQTYLIEGKPFIDRQFGALAAAGG